MMRIHNFVGFLKQLWQDESGNLGGGSSGSSRTTTTQELAPEQKELLSLVIPEAKNISQNTPELFPGSTIAGFNPNILQAQQSALDTGQNVLPQLFAQNFGAQQTLQQGALPASTAGLGQLISGLGAAAPAQNFLLSGAALDPNTNPALQSTIEAATRPITENLTQNVLPSLRGEAVSAGQYGGSRQGIAEGLASQGALRSIGDTAANISTQGYLSGLQGMQQALGTTLGAGATGVGQGLEQGLRSILTAPTLADLALQPANLFGAVGEQQRQMEQALLSEQAQRFASEQLLPFSVAQDVAQLAFGIPGGSATSSVSGRAGDVNPIQSALGMAALGASLFPGSPGNAALAGGGIGTLLALL